MILLWRRIRVSSVEKQSLVRLVEDDDSLRKSVSQWLSLSSCSVETFDNGQAALEALTPEFDGVIVSDVRMPGMDGFELLEAVQQVDQEIPVVLFTGHGDVSMAVQAMKRAAYDFIEKPFSPERLLEGIERASQQRALILENRRLRHKLASGSGLSQRLIGNSEQIRALRLQVANIANTRANVLLIGETGTGKEVVARALHDLSDWSEGPFQAVNCGALPETLIESELFGHEAGAFSGAAKRRIGLIESAQGGTLFLDEIATMPPAMQVKLLRTLETRELTRLGSSKSVPVSFRLISAANESLATAAAQESFRPDLYYRVNTIQVDLPPLRERGDDIVILFRHFVAIAEREFGRIAPDLQESDLSALRDFDWPGNVRELRNVADRYTLGLVALPDGLASLLGLTAPQPAEETATTLAERTATFERDTIIAALVRFDGNVAQVLEFLDVPRRTLNDKMARYGIKRT